MLELLRHILTTDLPPRNLRDGLWTKLRGELKILEREGINSRSRLPATLFPTRGVAATAWRVGLISLLMLGGERNIADIPGKADKLAARTANRIAPRPKRLILHHPGAEVETRITGAGLMAEISE
ncbi:MAG: hypothetical protein V3S39_00775 [Thermodesulfobacteriota bacterium]